MNKDERVRQLVEIGREVAAGQIKNAVVTATDDRQMVEQLLVLKVAATSILAHQIFNEVMQHHTPRTTVMQEIVDTLRLETDALLEDFETEMEVVYPKYDDKGILQ